MVTFSGLTLYPDSPFPSSESPLKLSLGISIVQYVILSPVNGSTSNGSLPSIRFWSNKDSPLLVNESPSKGIVLLRIIERLPWNILKTYWSVGFPIPHSIVAPVMASVEDLRPKVNPLILPGWYLNTLLDCILTYFCLVSEYPGRVLSAAYFEDPSIFWNSVDNWLIAPKSNTDPEIGSLSKLSLISLQVSVQISTCANDSLTPAE